jgi:cysteine desulfurase family protein (TIGR01976 family)
MISTQPFAAPSLEAVRSRFPSLASGFAFLENAGGSQVPDSVPEAIRRYMLTSYVQLAAGYPASTAATETVERAHAFANLVMNGTRTGKAILGASATALVHVLANAYGEILGPGDEIIVSDANHEANAGPWYRLERFGIRVRPWPVDPETQSVRLDELEPLLNERTRIVAFPHVSNLLGEIVDVEAITRRVHEAGARVAVDGVAYAPHRAIDVEAWNVDWYFFSVYKVFGPHMAALYGRTDALAELTGPNHFFIPNDSIPLKFEPGGITHEGCAGWLAVAEHLNFLSGREEGLGIDRQAVADAFSVVEALEMPLQARYLEFLNGRDDLAIVGPSHGDPTRVATVSFLPKGRRPSEVAAHVNARGVGIRSGHMYSYRLCKGLGIDTSEGVVRASFAHYNSPDEVERLIGLLDEALNH